MTKDMMEELIGQSCFSARNTFSISAGGSVTLAGKKITPKGESLTITAVELKVTGTGASASETNLQITGGGNTYTSNATATAITTATNLDSSNFNLPLNNKFQYSTTQAAAGISYQYGVKAGLNNTAVDPTMIANNTSLASQTTLSFQPTLTIKNNGATSLSVQLTNQGAAVWGSIAQNPASATNEEVLYNNVYIGGLLGNGEKYAPSTTTPSAQ